jgi:hypothetical protein
MEKLNELEAISSVEVKPDVCFVSSDTTLIGSVEEAVKKTKHELTLWAKADAFSSGISNDDSKKHIQESRLVIFDITRANTNIMLDIGFVFALDKPFIFITNNSRSIPETLIKYRVLIFEIDNIQNLSEKLSVWILDVFKNPNSFTNKSLLTQTKNLQNVFISYSHKDEIYMNRVCVHLKPLEKMGLLDVWSDKKIKSGDRWRDEIENALKKANVAILLVSADYLASDFIVNNELPPLLKNAEDKGTRIIPVILKPCRFTRDKSLSIFHSINDPKDALIALTEGKQEEIYDNIANEVENRIK